MSKTPDYVKDAVKNYRKKFDIVQVRLDKGTIDRIKALGLNTNQFINSLVSSELNKLERGEKTINQVDSSPLPKEIDGKPVYRWHNEEEYIKSGEWWRNIIFFSDDMELNDLFIKMLDKLAEENDNFKDGCRIVYDLINIARLGSKYTEEQLEQMSQEDISKIPESELKFDQTDELKNLMRGFVYNGEKQPLFDFIEM